MTLNEIADELIEVRRYVRIHVEYTRGKAVELIQAIHDCIQEQSLGLNHALRLQVNLGVGLEYIQVDPDLLENALYNAAFEIRAAARLVEENPEEPMTWEKAAKILNIPDDEDI